MIRPRMIGVAVAALVALLAPVAGAGLPTEQLRGAIERVVKKGSKIFSIASRGMPLPVSENETSTNERRVR